MLERNITAAVISMFCQKNHVIFLFGKMKLNTTVLLNVNVDNYVKKSTSVAEVSYQFQSSYASRETINTTKVVMSFWMVKSSDIDIVLKRRNNLNIFKM